jgi:hypothetical protein
MADLTNAIITYADFLSYHGNISGEKDRKLIEGIIAATSQLIENATRGTVYIQRTFTEDYSGGIDGATKGGAKRIYLRRGPISSVTSITDDDSTTISSDDYTVVNGDNFGYLEHDSTWPAPTGRWTIIYVAGKESDRADLDDRVQLACKLESIARYEMRKPGMGSKSVSGRAGSKSMTIMKPVNTAGLVSDEAYSLIAPDIRSWA